MVRTPRSRARALQGISISPDQLKRGDGGAMKRDNIFAARQKSMHNFEFDSQVAEVFDDMLERSVPFYAEQQCMIQAMSKSFWIPGTQVYDLGCSTGTTLEKLARELGDTARLTGYDNSAPMADRARQRIANAGLQHRVTIASGDLNSDLSLISLQNASVVTMCWTLQFIRPLRRDDLVRWIYRGLVDGGALILTEKILTNSSHVNRFFIDYYYDLKRQNGYSETEISRKREALENVLVPYRLDENLELFRRNGFEVVETFFQWFNFAGFLCVKRPPASGSDS
jgi:tRNA (cmo5U34)-methyltransferase